MRWVVLFCLMMAGIAQAADHARLDWYTDSDGKERAIQTAEQWQPRRAEILVGMEEAMGPLPDRSHLPGLDVKILGRKKIGKVEVETISFLAERLGDGEDRVPALL